MTAQTNARDIPARKADVDAVIAAIQVLGVAGLALEAGGNLEAVKDALVSGGYSGSRLNTIANALTSGGYSADRLNDIKVALEAGGATYLLLQALEALLTTIDADTSRIPASPATEDGNLAAVKIALETLVTKATPVRFVVPVAGLEDGDEIEVTAAMATLGTPVADTIYEMRCFRSTLATTTGASTHRQRSIYEATGAAPEDQAWEEPVALAIASGVSYPYSPGPTILLSATASFWVSYSVTPGAGGDDITETLVIDLLPVGA